MRLPMSGRGPAAAGPGAAGSGTRTYVPRIKEFKP